MLFTPTGKTKANYVETTIILRLDSENKSTARRTFQSLNQVCNIVGRMLGVGVGNSSVKKVYFSSEFIVEVIRFDKLLVQEELIFLI